MDVQERHGLAGNGAIIDADVAAIGLVLLDKQCCTLDLRHSKKQADVALGNEPAAPQGHRVAAKNQRGLRVLLNVSAEIIE